MHVAVPLLAMGLTVIAVSWFARRFQLPEPLLLVVVGVGASFLPFVPRVDLEPEVILVGLLPPLLYAAAVRSSLVDFAANKRAIVTLSVVLVVVTALAVGLVTWWLLPVSFAVAFALGAVVAPPDAVAATAVARRIGLPRRVVTLLEGESLLNDATALVCLNTAIAAMAGVVTPWEISLDFALSAFGGTAVGLVVALGVAAVKRRLDDKVLDTALSLLTPFAAYLLAEEIHGSGVVAVVVAGLLLAHKAPLVQTAGSRVAERINWSTISFLLEASVFLLIGLEVRWVLGDVLESDQSVRRTVGLCLAVLLTCVLVRPLVVFASRFLYVLPGQDRTRLPSWTRAAVVSWAGMRGVVTLAAALALPADTPLRELLILAAMVVVAGTLVVQGSTLPWLARRLDVRGPDPREDALQEASLTQVAVRAGLADLDRIAEQSDVDPDVLEILRRRSEQRANTAWERLATGDEETPAEEYRRLRLHMLSAERRALLQIRDAGSADHEVLEHVFVALDQEESMLDRATGRAESLRSAELLPPEVVAGACEHLATAPAHTTPLTPRGCPDCEREGTRPVHLRLCLDCGYVGCCSSSVGNHAEKHYEATGHPVMRSFEAGESWRWCYVDDLLG